jgi:hypothetical protein
MSIVYQPFLISEFKTGLYDYLQPWIRPADAFEPLVNAYVYRGVLQKRNGSTVFGDQLEDESPVMGIMQYQDESTGIAALVVASTKFLYLYTPGSETDDGTFSKIISVADSPFWSGTATSFGNAHSIPTLWTNLTASTISITDGSTTITDDGSGGLGNGGIFAAGGTINYITGVVALNFAGTTENVTLEITATISSTDPIFTGTIRNFFNWTNWQPTSSITSIATSYLYMTNDVDPVTLFDGVNLARPGFYVNDVGNLKIEHALDVKTYNNRLLLIRPTITGESNPANQDIYYSASFNPFDFVGNVAGHGGAISAATGDRIISSDFLRDNLVIAFSNSTWSFQISGLANPPFIFRRLNSSKSNKCPYASVQYDERVTNLGSTGFLACDGVNVQRFDIPIIDYYESQIAQNYFNQDFSQRYDNLTQTWMFYPSYNDENPLVDFVAPGSDETLVYNFLENTWATYQNSFPMTCMGLFNATSGTTWEELDVDPQDQWENTQAPWFSYGIQSEAPLLLGGDTEGNVYHLDNPIAVRDGESNEEDGTSFNVSIKTTRWNPFMQSGEKTQFGYIDVYYSKSSVDPSNPIQVTFQFYVDNSTNVAASRTLTFDGPVESDYAWKRVYCNLMGEFIQIGIDPSEDAPFQILGFVLWARPAGRLTP